MSSISSIAIYVVSVFEIALDTVTAFCFNKIVVIFIFMEVQLRMYETIIEIKKDVPADLLNKLECLANDAFCNRAGRVVNTSNVPHLFVYKGRDEDYGCLELGALSLWKQRSFVECVQDWRWIDADPDENCDMLEVFARHAG